MSKQSVEHTSIPNHKCIFVVGMHRSGTSAVAGLLQRMGVYLGSDLMQADKFNEKGYFENKKVFEINERILDTLGITWHSTYELQKDLLRFDKITRFYSEIENLIREEFGGNKIFAIKDPRLGILLPLWQTVTEKLGIETACLFPIRHPSEVTQSFKRPHPLIKDYALLLWIDYNIRAEMYTRKIDRRFIAFETLINNPLLITNQIRHFIGITVQIPDHKIPSFVDDRLRHFYKDDGASDLDASAKFLWEVFEKLVKDDHERWRNALDEFRVSYEGLAQLFARANHSKEKNNRSRWNKEYEKLLASSKEQSDLIANIKRDLKTKSDLADEIKGECERLELELTITQKENAKLKADNESRERELKLLKQQKEQLKGEIKDFNLKTRTLSRKVADLIDKIHDRDEELVKEKSNSEQQYEMMLKMIDLISTEKEKSTRKIAQLHENVDELNERLLVINQDYLNLRNHSENLARDKRNLQNSVSFRLGFALSRPFHWLFTILKRSIIVSYVRLLLQSPLSSLRMLNFKNLKTLLHAIREEPRSKIIENMVEAITRTATIRKQNLKSGEIKYAIDKAQLVNNQYLIVRGWTFSDQSQVVIKVKLEDGKEIVSSPGEERRDVYRAFKSCKNSLHSGFLIRHQLNHQQVHDQITVVFTADKNECEATLQLQHTRDFSILSLNEQYRIFLKQHSITAEKVSAIKARIAKFKYHPKISIVTPVYNVDPQWLNKCITSVLEQIYSNWELCLYDDASTKPETLSCLSKWSSKDSRIRVVLGKENLHIAEASNQCLKMASGQFVGLLDNDDELTTDALFQVVEVLNENPELDFIYSDEDKIELDGQLVDPHFKPDWSPETFESMMYTCHFSVFRKTIIDQVGGFRKGYEGSQDYDLVLRITELTDRIHHIPRILYHWRKIPGSAAASTSAKSYAYEAAKKALESRLVRLNQEGSVEHGKWLGSYRIKRSHGNPSVAIIIPFKDEPDLTIDCVNSVLRSSYANFKIYLISNNSSRQTIQQVKNITNKRDRIKLLELNIPFNFSAINNWAVNQTSSDHLLFLNNDTSIITRDWIEAMVELSSRTEIGAVGAKLLYPDNTIQHAGVILGIVGVGNHAFRHQPAHHHGYFGYSSVIRNYSAVTGACLMVERKKFLKAGGFDEQKLKVAYNDIDLCLQLTAIGYRNVYTPFAELYHHESKSRGFDDMSEETQLRLQFETKFFRNKWPFLETTWDKYYNPNLTVRDESFSLKLPIPNVLVSA